MKHYPAISETVAVEKIIKKIGKTTTIPQAARALGVSGSTLASAAATRQVVPVQEVKTGKRTYRLYNTADLVELAIREWAPKAAPKTVPPTAPPAQSDNDAMVDILQQTMSQMLALHREILERLDPRDVGPEQAHLIGFEKHTNGH